MKRKLKLKKKNKCNNNVENEKFIINFHKEQIKNGIDNNDQNNTIKTDQRRTVFISLIGLYQTWKQCPSSILYSSIFILPLKSKWIYNPTKYENEISQNNMFDHCLFHGLYL